MKAPPLLCITILIFVTLHHIAFADPYNDNDYNALMSVETNMDMDDLYKELRNLSQRLDAVNYRVTIDSWFTALLTSDLQSRLDNLTAELGLDDDMDGLRMRLQSPNVIDAAHPAVQDLEKRLGVLESNELHSSLDHHVQQLNERIDAQNRLLAGFLPSIGPDEVEQQLIEITARVDTLELASVTNDAERRLNDLSECLNVLINQQNEMATQAALNELTMQLADLSETINALAPLTPVVDVPVVVSSSNVTPSNCRQAMGEDGVSGIYEILVPSHNDTPFHVYCDAQYGGGWIVVQRRGNAKVNFNRNWLEYKRGFGHLNDSYFIGLDKLYALTHTTEKQELFIILTDFNGVTKTAHYTEFAIGNEKAAYALQRLGNFVGSSGLPDSLRSHVSMKFSTKDQDNDLNDSNRSCALRYSGAWWFNNCLNSHLNGKWLPPNEGQGIIWRGFHSGNKIQNLKFAQMMIRPRIH